MTESVAASMHLRVDEIEARMAEATARIDRTRAIHDVLADVVGAADTADGYVHVEFGAGGLSELTINSRAMNMMATDLAEEIKRGLTEAQENFRARTVELLEEHDIMPKAADLERERTAARADFERAQQDFTSAMRAAADNIGQAARLRTAAGDVTASR